MKRTRTAIRRPWVRIVLTGLGAGFLAGLFGVGGGLVIVPALTAFVGMDQRRAAATSLVAIVPTSIVGAVSYGVQGQVSLVAAVFLVLGSLIGAQIGVRLLRALPARILPWIFVAFALFVIVSQQIVVPVRDAGLTLTPGSGAALVGVGLVAGVLSGLVGVGGGAVIVPGTQLAVGMGDLLARGTSLVVMLPTALSGTITNLRHGVADVRIGLVVGVASAAASPAGSVVAGLVSPRTGSVLFSLFLVYVIISTLLRARGSSPRSAA
ncbi:MULTISPECIES: sulfite exporter TauE/SafE family protein [unclassified Actinomyces]|uniref:sulfite exporter TauE/SafE family protein n=1 Tax=unclassified Actinomyces TaxID=2609248 RepID=UPI0013745DC9|nr:MULTISPECIES: sulfite exporter TauE/SafE family protein [unclassified Actinomyces]NDR54082.1 sulfite exporter TauE/SafE family protein [Actinomyces sp. 565]QHO90940.1 sulfite exporter TauE/SafE family protein [Actinomyces sp. 432]